ncbi:MAG: hypothetical protein ACRDN0_07890 [Trebonia sp.]
MVVSARPVHFTARRAEMEAICEAMGLPRVEGAAGEMWQVFSGVGADPGSGAGPSAGAGGAVAIHEVAADDPLAGRTDLGFEADDIDVILAGLRAAANLDRVIAEIVAEDHGRSLRVTMPDGLSFLVDTRPNRAAVAAPASSFRLEPSQMWFTGDVPGAADVLRALDATLLISSRDPAGWADTRMPGGGRTQAHRQDRSYASAGFMLSGRLEDLRDRLFAAGLTSASIIDETFGRMLVLDGPDGAELAWVNQEQDDYYGYVVHHAPDAAAG